MLIETQRLYLRKWELSDAAEAFGFYGDPDVSKYLGDGKPVPDIATTEKFLAKFIEHENNWGFSPWAVVHRESEKLIGICGFHTFNADQEIELGFRFLRTHWGQGFASEACRACVDFIFLKFPPSHIAALTDEQNAPTKKVLTKIGFYLVGPSIHTKHSRRYLRYEYKQ